MGSRQEQLEADLVNACSRDPLVLLQSGVHQKYTERSGPTTRSSSIRKNGARGGSRTHEWRFCRPMTRLEESSLFSFWFRSASLGWVLPPVFLESLSRKLWAAHKLGHRLALTMIARHYVGGSAGWLARGGGLLLYPPAFLRAYIYASRNPLSEKAFVVPLDKKPLLRGKRN